MKKENVYKRVIQLIFITYMFLVSVKLMGGAFKMFGSNFAEQLITATSNPLVGLFIGILATSIVQSSSATTSIVVGLVASGTLPIGGAIPIIMGSNIGTSVTNTVVSLGHINRKKEFKSAINVATVHDFFNFIVVAMLFPIEIIFHPLEKLSGVVASLMSSASVVKIFNPLDMVVKPMVQLVELCLFSNTFLILTASIIGLFLSLKYFVSVAKPLAKTEFKTVLNKHIFNKPFKSFVIGAALTGFVQSSSVTTSLLVPIAASKILSIKKIFPFIIGANVGTTFTAIIAAIILGVPAGLVIAFVHFFFNIIGSAMVYPIRKIPIELSKKLSEFAVKSPLYPIAYVLLTFYIIPSMVVCVSYLV